MIEGLGFRVEGWSRAQGSGLMVQGSKAQGSA
jgi:hypothetical protein